MRPSRAAFEVVLVAREFALAKVATEFAGEIGAGSHLVCRCAPMKYREKCAGGRWRYTYRLTTSGECAGGLCQANRRVVEIKNDPNKTV